MGGSQSCPEPAENKESAENKEPVENKGPVENKQGGGGRRRKTRGRKSKRGRQTISKRLRKHAHSHTKRHIKCMRALIKQGYSFKKAHRAALRKVGH